MLGIVWFSGASRPGLIEGAQDYRLAFGTTWFSGASRPGLIEGAWGITPSGRAWPFSGASRPGVVRVAGESDPLLLHGVHHLFHPPLRAPAIAWPAGHSTLVLIVRGARGLDAAALRAGFLSCIA